MSFERDARCKHGNLNPGGSGGCPECHEEEFGDPYLNEIRADQKKYWPAIQWLTEYEIRGRGRSTLLALAFIKQADKHIGTEIRIWDHYDNNHQTLVHVEDRIADFLRRFRTEYPSWSEEAKTFQIDTQRHTLVRIR